MSIGTYERRSTRSIRSVLPPEAFYWLAVLFTFTLETAADDLLAEQLDLGYLTSVIVFAVAIGVIALALFAIRLGAVVAFWLAYILTRPLGASLGDFLSQPTADGGLGLGAIVSSLLFLAAIVALVVYVSVTGRDAPLGLPLPLRSRRMRSSADPSHRGRRGRG